MHKRTLLSLALSLFMTLNAWGTESLESSDVQQMSEKAHELAARYGTATRTPASSAWARAKPMLW